MSIELIAFKYLISLSPCEKLMPYYSDLTDEQAEAQGCQVIYSESPN